jgi:hypothetical protein
MAQPSAPVTLAEILVLVKKLSPINQVRLIEQVAPEIERALVGAPQAPRTSLCGILRDLGPAPSAEDIDEARREAWSNFPREMS